MTNNTTDKPFISKTGLIALLTGVILVFVLFPFLKTGGNAQLLPYWLHDHFFNTVEIAENIKNQGFPSLDTLSATNDFSPFWIALLLLYSKIFTAYSTAFFALIWGTIGLAAGISILLMNRLIKKLKLPYTPIARFFGSALFLAMYLRIAVTGSDAIFAVPVVFLLATVLLKTLNAPSFKTGFLCGLTFFFAMMVRFDAAVFMITAALVFYFQFNGKAPITTKELLKVLGGMFVGVLPIFAWFAYAEETYGAVIPMTFHSWTQAQNMVPWQIITVLFVQPIKYITKIPTSLALQTFPVVLLILTAYNSFPWTQEVQKPKDTVFYSLIWFPVLSLFLIAFMTYIALPEYAYYSLTVGAPIALVYATGKIDTQLEKANEKDKATKVWFVLGVLLLLIGCHTAIRPRSAANEPIMKEIKAFTSDHAGIYAMGNGAGMAAYVSEMPFVRLDGLANDLKMQEFLAAQGKLKDVFKHYGVDYYISVGMTRENECFSAREPYGNHLGANNKGMSDWLCMMQPVYSKAVAPDTELMIFAVNAEETSEAPKEEIKK